MLDLSLPDYILLFATTFAAGFLNATVGGGGLVQVPVLMLVLPHIPIATIIGTAKLAGVPGLVGAVGTYMRRFQPAWPRIRQVSYTAVPSAIAGAAVATRLDPAWARPIILVLLVAMTAHVLLQSRFGEAATAPSRHGTTLALGVGAAFGFYEGFFGAGSSSILLVFFVVFLGLDMVGAAIASAIVTLIGAGVALVYFLAAGRALIPLGVAMAGFNIAGALAGTRFVSLKGNVLLRRMLAVVLVLLVAKLAWDWF